MAWNARKPKSPGAGGTLPPTGNHPSPAPPSPPGAASDGAGDAFVIGWVIFQLTVWTAVSIFAWPRLLEYVGGDGLARWLEAHLWVRLATIPILGPLLLLTAFTPRDTARERAAGAELASAVGGTVLVKGRIDPAFGMTIGPGLRVPLGPWSVEIATWSRDDHRRTVARVRVAARTDLSFVARAPGREPELLSGLQQRVVAHSLRLAARAGGPGGEAFAANLAYLSEAPVTLGQDALDREVVLRSNQPDAARALFTDGAVAAALAAFAEERTSWQWTHYPDARPGHAEMCFERPGSMGDAADVERTKALLLAALTHLASAGVIATEG